MLMPNQHVSVNYTNSCLFQFILNLCVTCICMTCSIIIFRITLETAPNGSGIIVGGVKIDMEDFLLNPNEMCGQHHIPIVTPEAQPAGTITITLQLSLEFIAKSFVAVRPKPVPSSSSTHRFSSEAIQHHVSNMTINQPIVLSSLVTPYKSIKVDIRTISCTKEQLKDVNRVCPKCPKLCSLVN